MLLGLVLFYVGAVLILNGLWMLERISDREIWVINLFVGVLSLLAAFRQAFGADADAASVKAAALSLLFSLTYLWLAANRFSGVDGRGLGGLGGFVAAVLFATGAAQAGHAHRGLAGDWRRRVDRLAAGLFAAYGGDWLTLPVTPRRATRQPPIQCPLSLGSSRPSLLRGVCVNRLVGPCNKARMAQTVF